jgi:hypothetical protein
VPRSRFDELAALAEENDGLVTADHARHAGFTDSVLARLVQGGRIRTNLQRRLSGSLPNAGPFLAVPGSGPLGEGEPRSAKRVSSALEAYDKSIGLYTAAGDEQNAKSVEEERRTLAQPVQVP